MDIWFPFTFACSSDAFACSSDSFDWTECTPRYWGFKGTFTGFSTRLAFGQTLIFPFQIRETGSAVDFSHEFNSNLNLNLNLNKFRFCKIFICAFEPAMLRPASLCDIDVATCELVWQVATKPGRPAHSLILSLGSRLWTSFFRIRHHVQLQHA